MEQRNVYIGDGVLTALQHCTTRAKGPESDSQVQLHWMGKLFAERSIWIAFPLAHSGCHNVCHSPCTLLVPQLNY